MTDFAQPDVVIASVIRNRISEGDRPDKGGPRLDEHPGAEVKKVVELRVGIAIRHRARKQGIPNQEYGGRRECLY